jgi:hypothetical protein
MPRNATSKGKKEEHQQNFPLEVYEKLPLPNQIACYKFFRHLNTAGAEGWSPTEIPGSRYHYRSSNYIRTHIKQSSWPKIGKVG